VDCISYNLKFTKLDKEATVLNKTVQIALEELKNRGVYDIIFMDPPYNNSYEKDVLSKLIEYRLVDEDSIIIVEASLLTKFDYLDDIGFEVFKNKEYKTNKHVFIRMK
jgi:16S rRNA (guanine966-N2)-methyltransferase